MNEAAKSRYLASRLRQSLAQGGVRKPVAAKGHGRLLTNEGRDANLHKLWRHTAMTDKCPHCHIPKHVRIAWMLGGLCMLIAVFYAGAAFGVDVCRNLIAQEIASTTGENDEN